MKYDYYTYQYDNRYEAFIVHGWGTYEESSVLAGQAKKSFLDSFDTIAKVNEHYPSATGSNKYMEPTISVNHLPEYGDIEHVDDGI
jgi:hypothetical protein